MFLHRYNEHRILMPKSSLFSNSNYIGKGWLYDRMYMILHPCAGNAIITATAADGSGVSASCSVTVTHGNMVHTPKKDATCTKDGNEEYWICGTCGKFFSDAEGKVEITQADAVIPAAGHKLTKTESKAATCTEVGNQEYWTCETCGKYFSDAEGKTEITLDSTVLPALGHDYKDGVCTRCEGKDPDYMCPPRTRRPRPRPANPPFCLSWQY